MLNFIFKVVSKFLMYSAIFEKDVKNRGELQGNTICTLNYKYSYWNFARFHVLFLSCEIFFIFVNASDFDDDSDVEVDRNMGERNSQEGTVYIICTYSVMIL